MASLDRVYWLSDSPCAGKTTVSDAMASRFNWKVYHADDHWDSHCSRARPDQHPTFYAISRITGDDLWLRPIEEQIRTEPLFITDCFPLILEDVKKALQSDSRNLIVDASVVPSSIASLIPSKNHIFYLIPEEKFQRDHYAQRSSIHPTLAKTSDPERTFSNWMARDAAFARWLEGEVDKYKLSRILVDGTLTLESTINIVAEHFRAQNG